MNPSDIKSWLSQEGLFTAHQWKVISQPCPLPAPVDRQIESLGRVFLQFYRASNLLYHQSVAGKMPRWIAELLDAGKPSSLVELQRHPVFKNALPKVIRPDLLLCEEGLKLTELDSVPGGIGLLSALQTLYLGEERMSTGFAEIFEGVESVRIVVSKESESYRPEMEYLARKLGEKLKVVDENSHDFPSGCAVYRFFELFDLPNIPCAGELFERALKKEIKLTPPPKPILEEKLFLALLWNRTLRHFWRQELGSGFYEQMLKLVPRSWVLDPTPLPPHGEYPELGIQDWAELKDLTQSQRNLVIKVSGFSEQAWGSRGVWIGSDLSREDWAATVDESLRQFPTSPRILMRFAHSKTISIPLGEEVPLRARVRLCPYYFVKGEQTQARANYSGTLATLCPENKKIIHGMSEAALVPTVRE